MSAQDVSAKDRASVDTALVRALEERCFNAWPALRTLLVDGWVLRLSDGHTRRNNSATPFAPSMASPDAMIDMTEKTFAGAGLRPVLRVTALADPRLEAALAARGYVDEDFSMVMTTDDAGPDVAPPPGVEVRLTTSLEESWIEAAMVAYGHGEKGARALRRSLPLILPAHAYVTVLSEGRPAAFGLGVAERGWLGLYDLVVDPALRGRGLGGVMVAALRHWGASQGAPRGYLQVRAANAPARALYARLGFRDAYGYGNFAKPS